MRLLSEMMSLFFQPCWPRQVKKCIYVLRLECKYFLVATIVGRGVRVEFGVEIHSALRRRTVSSNVDSKQYFICRNTNRYL